jgi:hypothetical protein
MEKEGTFTKELLEKDYPAAPDVEALKDRSENVAGFNVRPWGFDEIEKMTPVFEKIYSGLKARKLTLKDFYQQTKIDDGNSKIELINFDQLYFVVMPHVREVFKISTGASDSDLSKMPPEVMPILLLKIVMQNIGYLKNWFALTMAMAARTIA